MLELLNQLDGFAPSDRVKVIAATNRPDILDPALVRSGRLDRKVEIPLPDLSSRVHILRIHASKMKMSKEIDLQQVASICVDFSGAQLKAVCVEAGMIALRLNKQTILQSHLEDAVKEVQNKKRFIHNIMHKYTLYIINKKKWQNFHTKTTKLFTNTHNILAIQGFWSFLSVHFHLIEGVKTYFSIFNILLIFV